MDDVSAKVERQYNAFAYPQPIADLAQLVAGGAIDQSDPSLFSALLWPEGQPRTDLDILVAGCGTVQAALMAFKNPQCRVVGIDLAEAALDSHRLLKRKHRLDNLELRRLDVREAGALAQNFDLVISTGVLHHLADPSEGLTALRDVLKPDGAMFLMVYGAVGRAGVSLMQDAFRRMGVPQSAQGVEIVRQVLAGLPAEHPVRHYVTRTPELAHDAAIVDTFLHPQETAYTTPQLLAWLRDAGLAFQGWAHNHLYYPQALVDRAVRPRIEALAPEAQWAVVESLLGVQGIHMFVARPAGKAVSVEFSGEGWLNYRPSLPPAAVLGERRLDFQGLRFELSEAEAALAARANGSLTIDAILEDPVFGAFSRAEGETFASLALERLWKCGVVFVQKAAAVPKSGRKRTSSRSPARPSPRAK